MEQRGVDVTKDGPLQKQGLKARVEWIGDVIIAHDLMIAAYQEHLAFVCMYLAGLAVFCLTAD